MRKKVREEILILNYIFAVLLEKPSIRLKALSYGMSIQGDEKNG